MPKRFIGKLKDALDDYVVLEEETPPGQPAQPGAPRPGAAASAPPRKVAAPPMAPAGVATPEVLETLRAAVEKSAHPAYGQFRALLAAMSAVPDEALRYTLALNAAQASHGIDAPRVVESLEDRLRLLEEQRAAFRAAIEAETAGTIGDSERRVRDIDAEIARRQEEIRALDEQRRAMQTEVTAARTRIEETQASFGAAYEQVRGELAAERERLAAHLTTAGQG